MSQTDHISLLWPKKVRLLCFLWFVIKVEPWLCVCGRGFWDTLAGLSLIAFSSEAKPWLCVCDRGFWDMLVGLDSSQLRLYLTPHAPVHINQF